MKNQLELTLRLPEELLRKLIYISSAEGRSPNNHLLMLLRNKVQYFERTKGRIPPAELQAVALSQAYPGRRAAAGEPACACPSAEKRAADASSPEDRS